MKATPVIYRLDIGSAFYIGRANDFGRRRQRHLRFLRNGTHSNYKLQIAFDEGRQFNIRILVQCSLEDLEAEEQALLDQYFDEPGCANISRSASTGHETKRGKRD